jgi:hypothetical protein
MVIEIKLPGTPVNLGREFSLRPNDLARLGEEFYITNGGAVRRMTREKKEETIVRLTVKARRTSTYANDVISMFPGTAKAWNGFLINLLLVKPTNEILIRIDRA